MPATPEVTEVSAEVKSERESVNVILHNVVLKVGTHSIKLECYGLSEATELSHLINSAVARAEVVA